MMMRFSDKRRRPPARPTYGLVINQQAAEFSQDKIDRLVKGIAGARANWHMIKAETPREAVYQIKKFMGRRPLAIVACGGDSTVNLVARHLIRRTCILGILPLGRFNNLYRSLYGEPSLDRAIDHILSGKNRRIDYGLAGNNFFLGSVGFGLIPEMLSMLESRRLPRFGLSWSRLAARAAAAIKPIRSKITIDEFKFDITPSILNVNLLQSSSGLPLSPSSLDDDGKAEIIFDTAPGQTLSSSFVRKTLKKKYIYGDEIRLYRGTKVSVTPIGSRVMYLDGELMEPGGASLDVEIFPNKIRVFTPREA